MGMYGEWMRLSAAELAHAKEDLVWLESVVDAQDEADQRSDDEIEVGSRRRFGTDKAWHALQYLLARRSFPVDIISGEEAFVEDEESGEGDWGYGPPRYLTPEQVRAAASAMVGLTPAALIEGIDRTDLKVEDIYPSIWDRPDESLEWVADYLPVVAEYFSAAATAGEAVVCWIG